MTVKYYVMKGRGRYKVELQVSFVFFLRQLITPGHLLQSSTVIEHVDASAKQCHSVSS